MSMLNTLGMETPFEKRIEEFNKLINKHKKIVFFSGAGVSTASGICDFRSNDGLYNKKIDFMKDYTPEYALSKECFNHNPKLFYRYYREFLDVRPYEPNIAHKKVAEMEAAGILNGVVTQNIDGLHQKAGNKKVFEIHGTEFSAHCIKCGKQFDINYIFEAPGDIARCDNPKCLNKSNAFVKPDVTLYGETLPVEAVNNAYEAILTADMLIICGTSLQVEPAASMVSYFQGESIVTINREQLNIDQFADIVFKEDIAKVFSEIIVPNRE